MNNRLKKLSSDTAEKTVECQALCQSRMSFVLNSQVKSALGSSRNFDRESQERNEDRS